MPSLKRNISVNYVSQFYVTLVGILMLPIYIKYMGAEAYGLVGFFAMLQAWFNLLDLGLTPTIGRETARFRAGSLDALSFRRLFRALSTIFITIAFLGGGGLLLLSSTIAERWLKVETLPLTEIQTALQIMAISVALRWMCGLYRGVITGSEYLVWLGGFNSVIATVRFVGVLPVMWHFGPTPSVFFTFQLLVAGIEFFGLWFKSSRLLPDLVSASQPIGWSLAPIRPIIRFSLTVAVTASIWVMVTQTDKLVLSSILSLSEYGYFSLAVIVAGGVLIVGGPVSSAIMPRMAKLEAEGRHNEVLKIYRQSTQLVMVVAGAASITLAYCAEPLLWAWTGDFDFSKKAAPILTLYAIGNGVLVIAAFPYYLQYAKGDLRLHFIGHLLLLFILIPTIVYAANVFGATGAGYVWVLINVLYLLIWVAIVHGKLEPGLHWRWLFSDILRIGVPIAMVGWLGTYFSFNQSSRLSSIFYVLGFGGGVFICAVVMSTEARRLFQRLKRRIR